MAIPDTITDVRALIGHRFACLPPTGDLRDPRTWGIWALYLPRPAGFWRPAHRRFV